MKPLAALAAALVILHSSFVIPLHAQVPGLLNYQGRVAVEGVNFDGSGKFRFALVDPTRNATTYWSNDGSLIGPITPASTPSAELRA